MYDKPVRGQLSDDDDSDDEERWNPKNLTRFAFKGSDSVCVCVCVCVCVFVCVLEYV